MPGAVPRITAICLILSSPGLRADTTMLTQIINRHDAGLRALLERQVSDPASPCHGGIPDAAGLHHAGTAGGLLKAAAAAYFHPQSSRHQDPELRQRMRMAAAFLDRHQTPDGNIDLLTTNFNSPPDTGFVVQNVATAARLARMHGDEELFELLEPFLRKAGGGMTKGGIHTPNHRWVVCAALAQLHELMPDQRYVDRIDAWMAEGVDIDRHGQYNERSTAVYNGVTNTSLVIVARKLGRPALLEPVRQNLDAMLFLLHPAGEVVTEISRRQDLNTRGDLGRYWFSLRTLSLADGNGRYAAMLAPLEPDHADLACLLEYPELTGDLPAPEPLPDDFIRTYPDYGLTRIRRGRTSATILHTGQSRWVSLRQGEAVISAIRFSTAFFGKGQFVPTDFAAAEDGFHFSQELNAGYYQPIAARVPSEDWSEAREQRQQTEINRMTYEGMIREIDAGFEVTVRAEGTRGVPLTIEIVLREGGDLRGVDAVAGARESFLLRQGRAEYQVGADLIRFGPGRAEHSYIEVRGAEPRPPGTCVYLTGFTPFEHTLTFELR